MDMASDFESEDCGFESHRGHDFSFGWVETPISYLINHESEILQFYDYNVTEVRKGKFSTLNDWSKLFWVVDIARLSRDEFWTYFVNSQKLNEIENSKNALEPTSDLKWPNALVTSSDLVTNFF